MRSSMLDKLDREAICDRETPARRFAVILSSIFLLSLATVASLTSIQAGNGEQGATRVAIAALPSTAAH